MLTAAKPALLQYPGRDRVYQDSESIARSVVIDRDQGSTFAFNTAAEQGPRLSSEGPPRTSQRARAGSRERTTQINYAYK